MLYLNDDCLLEIFKLLNLKDQINLCQVQSRFRYAIVDNIWSRKYKYIKTGSRYMESLDADVYRNFFIFNSENIKSLEIEDIRNYNLNGYLDRFTRRPEFSFYFSLKMPNLKKLVCIVNHQQRIHDGYIQMLAKYAPNIEVLEILSYYITGTGMDQFKHLKKLYCMTTQKNDGRSLNSDSDNFLILNLSRTCPDLEVYFKYGELPYSKVSVKSLEAMLENFTV